MLCGLRFSGRAGPLDPPRTSSGAPRTSRPTSCRLSAPVTPQPHPPTRGFGDSRLTRVMEGSPITGLDRGHGRPARVVFRKTGGTPVPPGLCRPSYSPTTPAHARVQGLPTNSSYGGRPRPLLFWVVGTAGSAVRILYYDKGSGPLRPAGPTKWNGDRSASLGTLDLSRPSYSQTTPAARGFRDSLLAGSTLHAPSSLLRRHATRA